jgi:hypothetical protein
VIAGLLVGAVWLVATSFAFRDAPRPSVIPDTHG